MLHKVDYGHKMTLNSGTSEVLLIKKNPLDLKTNLKSILNGIEFPIKTRFSVSEWSLTSKLIALIKNIFAQYTFVQYKEQGLWNAVMKKIAQVASSLLSKGAFVDF